MAKNALLIVTLFFALSCSKDEAGDSFKQENGRVWLSGGLAFCAEQIHLDNGDTLIVDIEEIISYSSGDRVSVKYKETGLYKFALRVLIVRLLRLKDYCLE